ncbi:MAG: hypothetical protein A2542_02400 [Parcubacteria group bacterium RIFOXYD2_FULL_52_8]|nr:MAG: hypothetical protein A2542_02400 [Parcubacteria group bacterium RIFOXYD2_FULL_52_8]
MGKFTDGWKGYMPQLVVHKGRVRARDAKSCTLLPAKLERQFLELLLPTKEDRRCFLRNWEKKRPSRR